jgi:hypothetical protein
MIYKPDFTVSVRSFDNGVVASEVVSNIYEQTIKKVIHTEDEMVRQQLILLGWTPPPESLPSHIACSKFVELRQQGFRCNGLAVIKGETQGLITGFGKVIWVGDSHSVAS